MKKIFNFIVLFFVAFLLVGCDLGGIVATDKVVVEFETNGGSEVSKIELKVEDIAQFTLPEDPVKEGFVFDGWYLDVDLTNPFESLPTDVKNIKLYAKWEEEFSLPDFDEFNCINLEGEYNLSASVIPPVEGEEMKVNFEIDYDCNLDITTVTSLETLLADMNIKVKSLEELGIENSLEFNVKIQDGNLYIELPEELFADLPDTVNKIYFDLQVIADKMLEYSEQFEGQIPEDLLPEGFDKLSIEEMLEYIIDEGFKGLIANNEITEEDAAVIKELFMGLIEIFKNFIPKAEEIGLSVKYEITDEKLDELIDNLSNYIIQNIDKLYFFATEESTQLDSIEIDGCIYYYNEPKWIDENGVEHHYSEDLETLDYGILYGGRYYEPFYLGWVIYDTQDNWKLYNYETIYDDLTYEYYIILDNFNYIDENDVLHTAEELMQITEIYKQLFDEVEGTEYLYCYLNNKYYNAEYQLVDQDKALEDIAKYYQDEAIALIQKYSKMIKDGITINEMKLEYSTLANMIKDLEETIDIEFEFPYQPDSLEEGKIKAAIKFEFEHNTNYSTDRLSKVDLSEYVDMTTDLISLFEMELNPDIEFNPDDFETPEIPA